MSREIRKYEEQIIKEMEETKFFSWKRIWKAIQLSSLLNAYGK